MKRWTFLGISAAAAAILLAGCSLLRPVVGSGHLQTRSYALANYTRLQASNAFAVKIVPDARFSVTVTSDDNLGPYLVVERTDAGTLKLGLEQGYSYIGTTVKAEVHMPAIVGVDASGASTVTAGQGFYQGGAVTVTLSGASTATFAYLSCDELLLDISGASTANISGAAYRQTMLVSGASHANLLNCPGFLADVNLSGASDASVNAHGGTITLAASGGSTLYYAGTPSIQAREISGGSRVVRVN